MERNNKGESESGKDVKLNTGKRFENNGKDVKVKNNINKNIKNTKNHINHEPKQ